MMLPHRRAVGSKLLSHPARC